MLYDAGPIEWIPSLGMAWRIGIDSGGTFTDVCLFDESTGRIAVWKVSSTPADPSQAVAKGVEEGLAQIAASAGDVSCFGHGTTVATNALIQHRGARIGLITSTGFRDLLEIGRQKRPELYDLQADKPPALVERKLRLEVPERLRHDGSIEIPLDEAALRAAIRALREAGVEGVAICFLYSFLDARHEAEARRIAAEEFPDAFICASHQVAPEFREYERLSTTVVNAYLGPVMQFYISGVADRLTGLGVKPKPHLTQSNGGVIGFDTAALLPVRTILSGPSTGVVGARVTAGLSGFDDIITFDMGGTSTDVALIQGGRRGWRARRSCTDIRSRRRCSTSTRSAPAAARSPMSIAAGCSRSGRAAPVPIPDRPATEAAMTSRPSPTPISCCRR